MPFEKGDAGADFIEEFRLNRSYRFFSINSGGRVRLTSSELRPPRPDWLPKKILGYRTLPKTQLRLPILRRAAADGERIR